MPTSSCRFFHLQIINIMPNGTTTFNPDWENNEEYKIWIQRVNDPRKARCRFCKKTFDLSGMGEAAVKSHAKSQKHNKFIGAASSSLRISTLLGASSAQSSSPAKENSTSSPSPSALDCPSPSSSSSSSSQLASSAAVDDESIHVECPSPSTVSISRPGHLSSFFAPEATQDAEILWALKCCTSHYSCNSCADSASLFRRMFPDSSIAKNMTCGRDKMSYVTSFGLGPYFLDILKKKASQTESGYVLLFDESLNRELGKKQMDVHLRMWDNDRVITRFYNAAFMGHATAEDLFHTLESCIDLPISRMVQLSMDGPNVNLKVQRLLSADIEEKSGKRLIDVGTCGLHTIHNAFQAGHSESSWDLGSWFSSLFWLFKDTPARREDFITVTGCTEFPKEHAPHRWLENIPVAERALSIWPHVQDFINDLVKNKKDLKTKSFENLRQCMKDPLLTAKAEIFISIAKDLDPILVSYQTDKPVLPFLAAELFLRIKSMLGRFIKEEALTRCTTPVKLCSLDPSQEQLRPAKVDLGFKATKIVKEAVKAKKVSELQVMELQKQATTFLETICARLLKKSPLNSKLVRNLQWLVPSTILHEGALATDQLRNSLDILVDLKQIHINDCDDILSNFKIYAERARVDQEQFTFNADVDRLDTFHHHRMAKDQDMKKLWHATQVMLMLSHGQAQVERGFSFNKEVMVHNMAERTLVAKRAIVDHINAIGGLEQVEITPQMRMFVSSARNSYRLHLDEQRKAKEDEQKKRKREDEFNELEELKAKKARLEKDIENLYTKHEKLSFKAESTGKHTFLVEANAMLLSAKSKKAELTGMAQEIEDKIKHIASS